MLNFDLDKFSPEEQASLNSLSTQAANFAATLHIVAMRGLNRAYSNTEDKGAFAQASIYKVQPKIRGSLAHWYKRHGLNVIKDGQEYAIGGPLDRAKQNDMVTRAKKTPVLRDEVETRKSATVKPLTGLASERASKAIQSMVHRLREKDPDAATYANALLQKPKWFNDMMDVSPSDSEIQECIALILEMRIERVS